MQETEKELLALFRSIDNNHDNKLTKDELQAAFSMCRPIRKRALPRASEFTTLTWFRPRWFERAQQQAVRKPNSGSNLGCELIESRETFFEGMDVNGDGSISFEEWR